MPQARRTSPSDVSRGSLRNRALCHRSVGAEARFENERGDQLTLVVTVREDNQITLDGNRPLAVRPLVYRLRVASVKLSPAH
ncbi:hypothetical protein HUS23_07140 [Ectothiorhodospiraceae bacterium 2226]|nr:hypothetical protein HUS23_07140 [Ectothiorhodospiraceae bacterium 2226]